MTDPLYITALNNNQNDHPSSINRLSIDQLEDKINKRHSQSIVINQEFKKAKTKVLDYMINDETNFADLEKIESYYLTLNLKCREDEMGPSPKIRNSGTHGWGGNQVKAISSTCCMVFT